MQFLGLPYEVKGQIIRYLPGRDLKSIRVTCQQLHREASPSLFPVLYLSCHPLDLDVFRLVVANPLLVIGVRELVIDDTTLAPSLADWHNFRALARLENTFWPCRRKPYFPGNEPFDEPGRVWAEEPDKAFYDLFMSVFEPHHRNRLAHSDVKALREALPMMKALRSIVLTNRTADESPLTGAQSQESSSPTVRWWRRFGEDRRERPPFPPRCDWWSGWMDAPNSSEAFWSMDWLNDELQRNIDETGPPYSPDEAGGDQREREDEIQSRDRDDNVPAAYLRYPSVRNLSREARGVQVVSEVLSDPDTLSRLTEFRIDPSREMVCDMYQPGLPIHMFREGLSFTDRFSSLLGSAPHLAKFDLCISNGYTSDDGSDLMSKGYIARLLASLPHLEVLSLEIHGMQTWEAISDQTTFPNLRRVEFRCGDVWPEKFGEFIRRHAATLEVLRIEHCNIDRESIDPLGWMDPRQQIGTWYDVVEDIMMLQSTRVTKLREVFFHNVYGVKPNVGCGLNGTMDVSYHNKGKIYSWRYGIDAGLVKLGSNPPARRIRGRPRH